MTFKILISQIAIVFSHPFVNFLCNLTPVKRIPSIFCKEAKGIAKIRVAEDLAFLRTFTVNGKCLFKRSGLPTQKRGASPPRSRDRFTDRESVFGIPDGFREDIFHISRSKPVVHLKPAIHGAGHGY